MKVFVRFTVSWLYIIYTVIFKKVVPNKYGNIRWPRRDFRDSDFRLPSFRFPSFRFPSFRLPSFRLPSFRFPSFRLPSFRLPSFRLPSCSEVRARSPDILIELSGSSITNSFQFFQNAAIDDMSTKWRLSRAPFEKN